VIALILVVLGLVFINSGSIFKTRFVPTSSSTSTIASTGFSLYLSAVVAPSGSPGAITITVSDNNTLDTTNNATVSSDWQYPASSLNPYNPCGAPGPMGFTILQGHYDMSNYTRAQALDLYDASLTYMCTTSTYAPNSYYSFSPHSDQAIIVNPKSSLGDNAHTTVSLTFTAKGFWSSNGVSATFHSFPNGHYTILSADEWGRVVLAYVQISRA
jgi:hypothetical protein